MSGFAARAAPAPHRPRDSRVLYPPRLGQAALWRRVQVKLPTVLGGSVTFCCGSVPLTNGAGSIFASIISVRSTFLWERGRIQIRSRIRIRIHTSDYGSGSIPLTLDPDPGGPKTCGAGSGSLTLIASVVDRHRFDADPDPNFHFNADPDPDPERH